METYEILFNPEEKEGVFAISLVEHPAIEVDFVALSKEVLQLKNDELIVDGDMLHSKNTYIKSSKLNKLQPKTLIAPIKK